MQPPSILLHCLWRGITWLFATWIHERLGTDRGWFGLSAISQLRRKSRWVDLMALSSVFTKPEDQDIWAMRLALLQAREALLWGEVPVGAVVVRDGRLISQAFNLKETLKDPTAHAERIALTLAGQVTNDWRLLGCSLYVTLEPCLMCAGAILQSRMDRIVYGVSDPKAGACESLYRVTNDRRLNHRCRVQSGQLAQECGEILSAFFQRKRSGNRFNG